MDRRIQHARQLFNERITRAESEYHDAMRRAVTADVEMSEEVPVMPVVVAPIRPLWPHRSQSRNPRRSAKPRETISPWVSRGWSPSGPERWRFGALHLIKEA